MWKHSWTNLFQTWYGAIHYYTLSSLVPVWRALMFIQGHSVWLMVDYVRKMSVKKSCKYGEYGWIEHLIFLCLHSWGLCLFVWCFGAIQYYIHFSVKVIFFKNGVVAVTDKLYILYQCIYWTINPHCKLGLFLLSKCRLQLTNNCSFLWGFFFQNLCGCILLLSFKIWCAYPRIWSDWTESKWLRIVVRLYQGVCVQFCLPKKCCGNEYL